jgi:hypothetical protein
MTAGTICETGETGEEFDLFNDNNNTLTGLTGLPPFPLSFQKSVFVAGRNPLLRCAGFGIVMPLEAY